MAADTTASEAQRVSDQPSMATAEGGSTHWLGPQSPGKARVLEHPLEDVGLGPNHHGQLIHVWDVVDLLVGDGRHACQSECVLVLVLPLREQRYSNLTWIV